MKTRIRREGKTTIISFEGQISFEDQVPLREQMEQMIRPALKEKDDQIVFNLSQLDFVGSSGISNFVRALKEFNEDAEQKGFARPRYCHVKSEFRRIMTALDESGLFHFYDTEDRAIRAYALDNYNVAYTESHDRDFDSDSRSEPETEH